MKGIITIVRVDVVLIIKFDEDVEFGIFRLSKIIFKWTMWR